MTTTNISQCAATSHADDDDDDNDNDEDVGDACWWWLWCWRLQCHTFFEAFNPGKKDVAQSTWIYFNNFFAEFLYTCLYIMLDVLFLGIIWQIAVFSILLKDIFYYLRL